MINIDSTSHVSGQSTYIDDISVPQNCLFAAVVYSKIAHGQLRSIDIKNALNSAGVKAVLTAADIPGENQIGGIIPDEVLLADKEVEFYGQPLALVLADDLHSAQQGAALVEVSIDPREVITDARVAFSKNQLIIPPRTITCGDVAQAFSQSAFVVHGRAESGGQEHLYLETQGAIALPEEGRALRIISSTQGPTAVQRGIARVLGMSRHLIQVEVLRLGGGFGGKEDQATPWAALAALGAYCTGRPVKLVLHRIDDMRMTGKRHPYSSDYTIGIDKQGRILGFAADYYQNAGASADLSPAVLARTLFHATNCYHIPNIKVTGYSCRTNLPPNTAFRGFGGPQGMFVIESAIRQVAETAGLDPVEVQRLNLLTEDHSFHYGQQAHGCQARPSWEQCMERFGYAAARTRVEEFNKREIRYKKGLAVMPICFGISFTNTPMNQASSLVHIYSDGSIAISTAAVEMGQGVNTKIAQVAATIFSVPISWVRILPTSTTRNANTSPTAASSAADLNGKATQKACEALRTRLEKVAREVLEAQPEDTLIFCEGSIVNQQSGQNLSWQKLVEASYLRRSSLSELAYYATPDIYYDEQQQRGRPFAYHVYGTAICEVTLDTLRGTYGIDRVQIVHDAGVSMNKDIDGGQIEGALVQGIGWMTVEEVLFNADGKPLTDTLSTYKVPDIYHGPQHIEVEFLDNSAHPLAIFNSKAVGEPPLMYGIGVFFALREAIRAARPHSHQPFVAPLSPERVFMQIHESEAAVLEVPQGV